MTNVKFDDYSSMLDKWKRNLDFREINIQNEVIKPFLQSICQELDVIDVSKKGASSAKHDYFQYSGTYIDKGKTKASTPDLLVVKGWNWNNIEYTLDYRFTVEVKSPFLNESIFDKKIETSGFPKEIILHLSAKKINKVILTDGLKWIFYSKDQKSPKVFKLFQIIEKKKWVWDSTQFDDLVKYITNFAENEKDGVEEEDT